MKIEVHPSGVVKNDDLKYAVIITKYKDQYVFVKHKDRETWEIPGGHREKDEYINDTAARELMEETGAKNFDIKPVCIYSVEINGQKTYGHLFYAEIFILENNLTYEIQELALFDDIPTNLTYPQIQPVLFSRVRDFIEKGYGPKRSH